MEECWLFEAVSDCYLPLLELIQTLPSPARLAISLSPTLLEMWSQPTFPSRYLAHLDRLSSILESEAEDGQLPAERRELARYYIVQIEAERHAFCNQWSIDLPAAFGKLAREGRVELFTTAATHAFLPAHQNSAFTRHLQIKTGVELLKLRTGVSPKGFWLPECGYFPGLESDLASMGIEWFIAEAMGGAPMQSCPNGVVAIARNQALSRQVWDAQIGYPGHPDYREFHQDAGQELTPERAGQYRMPDGSTLPLGLKYWRVTGGRHKLYYDPAAAQAQAEAHAQQFCAELAAAEDSFIALPFDAELFGHWWHEGPHWLGAVLSNTPASLQATFTTPTQVLTAASPPPTGQPKASTWGRRSDFSFWINPETDWIYPQLCIAEKLLTQAKSQAPDHPLRSRALAQMTRELMLAQASDWPFMLRAGATSQYAEERVRRHLNRFYYLERAVNCGQIDATFLSGLEMLDAVFPELAI